MVTFPELARLYNATGKSNLSMPPGEYVYDPAYCISLTSSNQSHGESQEDSIGNTQILALVNVYYAIIYLVGMTGNLLVMFVVLRYSKMHTVTNFFILSLALADICFLVNVPFLMVTTFKQQWIFGNLYCKIFYSMTTVNQFASSLFLMVMSADRYFAVCHAVRSNKYRTAKAAIVVCAITWITSITLMIPVFIYSGIDSRGTCTIMWPGSDFMDGMQAFTMYGLVLGFVFPLILIIAFYIMVLRKVRTLGPKNVQASSGSELRKRSHRKVTIMVLVVISAYIICWLPYWIAQVVLAYTNILHGPAYESHDGMPPLCQDDTLDPAIRSLMTGIFVVLQALCYTNSSVNPILYAMLSENFKKSFAAACCGRRAEMERMSLPEPSIYARSRTMAGSIRRKFFHHHDGDEEEDEDEHSPETQKTSMEVSRRSTTVYANSLHAPLARNGSVSSSNSHASHNGVAYQLVVKRDISEAAV